MNIKQRKMKRILVTGANGQLGQSIKEISKTYTNLEFVFTSRAELDITNEKEVFNYFQNHSFDAVVNCAAYTAVDLAEKETEAAYLVNALATKYLATSTAQQNIPFIHISTDYVFDGTVSIPRTEEDQVNPINIYGQTKLEGEQFALALNPKTLIIRTSWIYSQYGNNFVKTMLRLFTEREEIGVINDQMGSPTSAHDLAKAILQLLQTDELTYGIFNYSNLEQCTWYDFANEIKRITKAQININPIPTTAYPTPAKRPSYSLLDKNKIINTFGLQIPEWKSSLYEILRRIN